MTKNELETALNFKIRWYQDKQDEGLRDCELLETIVKLFDDYKGRRGNLKNLRLYQDSIDRIRYIDRLDDPFNLWTDSEIRRMKELGVQFDESALAIVDDYPFN